MRNDVSRKPMRIGKIAATFLGLGIGCIAVIYMLKPG